MDGQSFSPRNPLDWMIRETPDQPVYFFHPNVLADTYRTFDANFSGQVTYAVKANDHSDVLRSLGAAGMTGFDVASVAEMEKVRSAVPEAQLHYHNPVRSRAEIAAARAFGIASWSVDRMEELDKLGPIEGEEIAVRLHLEIGGAAYNFGSKFGASTESCIALLQAVEARGGRPAMTFHPGTQCTSAEAWRSYIATCAEIAQKAGVDLHRLNVGGGFASNRGAGLPDLQATFTAIADAVSHAFADRAPALVCEPGRAMVADAFDLCLRVKSVIGDEVFLNDGIYGALAEWRDLSPVDRVTVYSQRGVRRDSALKGYTIFGPTCDSLDRLDQPFALPVDVEDGDFLLVRGMGAYSLATTTKFNGYGATQIVNMLAPHNSLAEEAGHCRNAV